MKTQSFSKSIITLALTFACGLVANAASPRNYLYDTKEENGLITSKTIFLQADNGMLDKQVKYEFVYNEAGKVAVKKAYRCFYFLWISDWFGLQKNLDTFFIFLKTNKIYVC